MSRFNPHFPNANAVFDAADKFKQRCLLDKGSLFLGQQEIWTPDHFGALNKHFVQQPDTGDRGFWEKLTDQMSTCRPLDVALMAEVFWIVQLGPTNLKATTKVTSLQRIWNMKPGPPGTFPLDSPFLEADVLSGLGSAGPGYNNYLPNEIMFAVEAFAAFINKAKDERQALLGDGFEFAKWLDSIPSGRGRQLYHTLCHVLFPDSFERIFSQGNKYQVARAHKIWTSALGESRPALDAALLELRKRLEVQHPGVVDYYELPVGTLIKQPGAPLKAPVQKSGSAVGIGSALPPTATVEEPTAEYDIETGGGSPPTLRQADNLILYGPPGTGKTFEMQARMKQAFDRGEDFAFVAFHPSYSYEDFIGGLRPTASKDGQGIVVSYQKGPFLTLCEKAHSNPTQRFTLFIDEVNRANVAKVFGELITLIEPSKRVIAGSKANDNGAWVTLPGTNERFGVPDNINVVATMNTADRSIAMMDMALRRRFRFEECAPDPDQITPANVGGVDLPKLLTRINDRLEYLLDRDHLIGHAVFMGIESLDDLRGVLAQRVIPLLQEYFFEDLEKVRLVLTGSGKDSVFFRSRKLNPGDLFPGSKQSVGTDARSSFAIGDPATWLEEHIVRLYGAGAAQIASPVAADSASVDGQVPSAAS